MPDATIPAPAAAAKNSRNAVAPWRARSAGVSPVSCYMQSSWLPFAILCLGTVIVRGEPRALVFDDAVPGADPKLTHALRESVRAAGYSVESVDTETLAKNGSLDGVKLLVIPNARSLPVNTIPAVSKYAKSGNIIACGIPMWESLVTRVNGK